MVLLENSELKIINELSKDLITWKFIPPMSPHFGGIWESGVKSTKFHLKRILSNVPLVFEDFNTILVQIEAVLNSRPLSPLNNDPNDYQPLTPSHFLIGRKLTALPDVDLRQLTQNSLSKYQHLQLLHQHFWVRWSKEYINELQIRTKWKSNQKSLQENTLVLIKDDNLPPAKWLLGRIHQLHPGNDGITRVATIKTKNGYLKRSFSKICPLPCV
jgi:hypothetical protein